MESPEVNPLPEAEISLQCDACNAVTRADDHFCGQCGKDLRSYAVAPAEDVFTTLRPTLVYYFLTLLLLSFYKLTPVLSEGINGLVLISAIDVFIVTVFWVVTFRNIKTLLSFSSIQLKTMLLTIVGCILGAIVVNYIAGLINVSIYDDVYYSPYLFADTSHPFYGRW
ncbi:MAG TPA: hypothetical protein VD884_20950 [Ohtaekwangia sp.]|nr:hypothetical protein [Ohtaekwangia sp.]